MSLETGKALVVGAGIAGLRCALDLAETGRQVVLIDAADHIGGLLNQLDHQFPTDHCGMCRMLPLIDREAAEAGCLRRGLYHRNIELMTGTVLEAAEGEAGRFKVTLARKTRAVDPDLCLGLGRCAEVCPVDAPDPFNAGLSGRKAIYSPTPHAWPRTYHVDPAACTRCGNCVDACPTGAIDLDAFDRRDFRVLVVDDEPIVRDSLADWLIDSGFSAETAASGPEALQRLGAQTFEAMLLDIKMPGMDGVEVLEKAAADHPDLTVIMMTAYATVDTAVEAMKMGALDYLVKPFDPEKVTPMLEDLYTRTKHPGRRELEVGAVVLALGAHPHNPAPGFDPFGYRCVPGVLTSLEYERILSHGGPTGGRLERPGDGRPIGKVAFIQCVGSRDVRSGADFCSSACCMYAIKEAVLTLERNPDAEAAIFYMDLRTPDKTHQRYRDRAAERGVRFVPCRPHSAVPDQSGGVRLAYATPDGRPEETVVDAVVLAVGARPADQTARLADFLGLETNDFGFCRTTGFSLVETGRDGVFACGAFTGFKDIAGTLVEAHQAAAAVARTTPPEPIDPADEQYTSGFRDVSRQPAETLAVVCRCPADAGEPKTLLERLAQAPSVTQAVAAADLCRPAGRDALLKAAGSGSHNRILIGACSSYAHGRDFRSVGPASRLDPCLTEAVDIKTEQMRAKTESDRDAAALRAMLTGLARLRRREPGPAPEIEVWPRALVVGGGIAGMTAALTLADCGVQVDLVERSGALGGRLSRLAGTLEGLDPAALLSETTAAVERRPEITTHLDARVVSANGELGAYTSLLETADGQRLTLNHGAVVLAVGGREAATDSFGHGDLEAVMTQAEAESALTQGEIDPARTRRVVMIQCVDQRRPPRNLCGRVCCPTALKLADRFQSADPEAQVWIVYRDMMTTGFSETYFTRARRNGVRLVRYDLDREPKVAAAEDGGARVTVHDPILDRDLDIDADLVILGVGPRSALEPELAAMYGAELDADGFFAEADVKWRPVDGARDGVFGCGLALGPRNLASSAATGAAAAMRALRVLSRPTMRAARPTAATRPSLCALCLLCVDACPYQARRLDEENEFIAVNPALCQACGACAAACPSGAAVVDGMDDRRMFDVVEAALLRA